MLNRTMMVPTVRFELTTPSVSSWCSSKLSYVGMLAGMEGFEPSRHEDTWLTAKRGYHFATRQ